MKHWNQDCKRKEKMHWQIKFRKEYLNQNECAEQFWAKIWNWIVFFFLQQDSDHNYFTDAHTKVERSEETNCRNCLKWSPCIGTLLYLTFRQKKSMWDNFHSSHGTSITPMNPNSDPPHACMAMFTFKLRRMKKHTQKCKTLNHQSIRWGCGGHYI